MKTSWKQAQRPRKTKKTTVPTSQTMKKGASSAAA
jgi:hypothetical protein